MSFIVFASARIAFDAEAVDVPFEVALAHLEQVRGDLLRLVLDLARGARGRGARHRRRARTPGARAVRRLVGVAFLDLDLLRRQAQLGRDDLRVRRRVALPLAHRAETRDRAAGGIDADVAAVEQADTENVADLGRAGADDLGEGRDADAHQLAVGALLRLLAAQAVVVDRLQHFRQRGVIVAAVERPAERGRIGELLGFDEIAPADLGFVDVRASARGRRSSARSGRPPR